jgi:carbonic anhydrase
MRTGGWRRSTIAVGFLVVGACSDDGPAAVAGHAPAHWTYDGASGPEHWADLDPAFATCVDGVQQSPIELAGSTTTDLTDPSIAYGTGPATVVDNGHTVVAEASAGNVLQLDGTDFELVQVHFHTPSEHAVDGRHAAAEAHFVHSSDDDELAVLGVLLTEGAATHPAWDAYVGAVGGGEDERHSITLEWGALLPTAHTTYRYDGSLTTPPCTEGVRWVVLDTPVELGADQLAALVSAHDGNRRPIVERGDRPVAHDATAG